MYHKVIHALFNALNMLKGFDAGINGKTIRDDKMLIEYNGKRYFVQLTEIQNPSEDIFDDISELEFM